MLITIYSKTWATLNSYQTWKLLKIKYQIKQLYPTNSFCYYLRGRAGSFVFGCNNDNFMYWALYCYKHYNMLQRPNRSSPNPSTRAWPVTGQVNGQRPGPIRARSEPRVCVELFFTSSLLSLLYWLDGRRKVGWVNAGGCVVGCDD